MNILGLDFGRQHLGIALATTPLAQPLKTIPTNQALNELPRLISDHHIDRLVVGLSEGHIGDETKAFASKLQSAFNIPIDFHDETLTSKSAASNLTHAKLNKRRGPDHHYAAALILQDYLDHRA